MEWILKLIIQALVEACYELVMPIVKKASLKRGIKLTAKKNEGHIQQGTQSLNNGDINGWLKELNNEE